MHKFCKRIFQA